MRALCESKPQEAALCCELKPREVRAYQEPKLRELEVVGRWKEVKGPSEQRCQCPPSPQSKCTPVITASMNCHPRSAAVIDPLRSAHHIRPKGDLAQLRGTGGKWMFRDYPDLEATSLPRMKKARDIFGVPADQDPRPAVSLQIGCRRRARAGSGRGAVEKSLAVHQGGRRLPICRLAMKVTPIDGVGATAVI